MISDGLGDPSSYPAKLAVGSPNRATIEVLRESGARTVAEIGVYRGRTSEAIARYLDGVGELHLFDFADRVEPVATRLRELGYQNVVAHGNSYKALDSYNWSLMQLLEKHPEPIFDYVLVDGAHTWAHDALAFLLLDRLLKPGGYVDFAAYGWTLDSSPSLSPKAFPRTAEQYTQEQIRERQVALVVNLLVRRDPQYVEVVKNKIFRKLTLKRSAGTTTIAQSAPLISPVPGLVVPSTGLQHNPSTYSLRVAIGHRWNFGNELLRIMSSLFLAAVVKAEKLEGVRLPALGVTTTIDGTLDGLFQIKGGHVLPLEQMLHGITDSSLHGVVNHGYGQRLEYFSGQREFWKAEFDRLKIALPPISPSEVVVNIRAAEILRPINRGYFPLPLGYYDVILDELGMTPVFVGQVTGGDPYVEKLRLRYPTAQFIHGSIIEDFELLRRSHTKLLSISSFAWLAGWLGRDDSRVVMPVAGFFNPVLRPDVNLLPLDDHRFEFRQFSPMKRERAEASLDDFLDSLADASRGYPRADRSAYFIRDLGSNDPARFAVPTTSKEWSAFAEAVILQQRDR